METIMTNPVNFTETTIKEIKRLMQQEDFDASKVLRVGVKGGGCTGLTYVMGFENREEDDFEYSISGIRYVMKQAHEMYLSGMEINWDDGLNNRGFTFKNPNASATCGCGTSFAV